MPVLDIVDKGGRLHIGAPFVVLATMAYPADEEKRQRMILSGFVNPLVELKGHAEADSLLKSLSADQIRNLVRSPDPETINKDAGDHTALAWVVGEMLLFMLSLAVHCPDRKTGPTQALFTVARWCAAKPADRIAGERNLWEAWSHFKSAAHLIAVANLHRAAQEHLGKQHTGRVLSELTETDMALFLSIAEAIRLQAERCEILHSLETWKTPETLRLPMVKLKIPPPADDALQILSTYRP